MPPAFCEANAPADKSVTQPSRANTFPFRCCDGELKVELGRDPCRKGDINHGRCDRQIL